MADVVAAALAVIAKAPEPGRTKTRLSPPLSPADACRVAWACLHDTLDAMAAVRVAARHVLVLDGPAGPWVPPGFEIVPQRGDGLAARLAAAFADLGDPTVVIAMDTPQVPSALLTDAVRIVAAGERAAALGPASDGGFWLIGLGRGVDPVAAFEGVPMSVDETGAAQLARLRALGLAPVLLPTLRDVDTIEDVWAVADEAPTSRLAALAGALRRA